MKKVELPEIVDGTCVENIEHSLRHACAPIKPWAEWPRVLTAALVGAYLLATTAQGQLLFRFDSAEEYAANFREAGITSESQFVYSSAPGGGGYPGRVEKAFNYNETFLFSRPLLWGTDALLEFGALFLYRTQDYHPGRAGNKLFTIGLLSSDAAGFYNRPGFAYASIDLVVAAGGGAFRNLALISKSGVATSEDRLLTSSMSLASGWYELRGRWTAASEGYMVCEGALLWRGADGTAPSVEIVSLNGRHFNPDIAFAPSIFAGIDGVGRTDMLAFDDVWLIPEPSPWALLVLGAGGLVAAWRWKRPRRG